MVTFTGGLLWVSLWFVDMTVYNQIGDFVDMNELPLVIDYEDKVVWSILLIWLF